MKIAPFLIAFALASNAFSTPFEWRVNALETASRTFTAYHGETVELKPEFTLKGETITNLTYSLCYQTNGMDTVWWMVPGTTFLPEMDCGANAYRFFIRAEGGGEIVYRANGILRMLPSPGWTPNAVKLPKPVIDFATVAATNAPWTTQAEVKKAIEEATPAQPESHQYLRTDLWTLSYEPWTESSTSVVDATTNIHGKVVSYTTRTEATDGYVKLKPYYLTPFSQGVTLATVAVTDGPAETVEGRPLVVHGLSDTPTNVTVTAVTENGSSRSVSFTLSGGRRETTTSAKNYTADESALGTARKRINDRWIGSVEGLAASSKASVLDRCHGEATRVFKESYIFDEHGDFTSPKDPTRFVYANVYRNSGSAFKPGYDGGRNTGNGGSFVIGRRLIGNAAHWWGGVSAGKTCYVYNGETIALTMTGREKDLAEWAIGTWGKEGFRDRFGFDVNLISDIRVIEVAEDIPDGCVPNLLPYSEAVKVFEDAGYGTGSLDLSCGGWTIGQNNALYPVWVESTIGYGSGRFTVKDSTTVREDCLAGYNANPSWWTVRDGESGRPTFIEGNVRILVGAYHTTGGGASYICAADVIAELEREWGRDPDETLKRIKASDL